MEIPSEAVKYILYQRTAYQLFWNLKIVKMFHKRIPRAIYHWFVAIEAFMRRNSVKSDYMSDIQAEYNIVRNHLPANCKNFLDIGCGIAGIDVFISKHYNGQPHIFLLDKSQLDNSIYYSFNNKGAFYNSLEIAGEVLSHNKVDVELVTLIEATEDNDLNVPVKLDLVISLISWGYHYPVSVYIEKVCEALSADGVLILDIRNSSNGLAELENYFSSVKEIHRTEKYSRVLCQNPVKTDD